MASDLKQAVEHSRRGTWTPFRPPGGVGGRDEDGVVRDADDAGADGHVFVVQDDVGVRHDERGVGHADEGEELRDAGDELQHHQAERGGDVDVRGEEGALHGPVDRGSPSTEGVVPPVAVSAEVWGSLIQDEPHAAEGLRGTRENPQEGGR